MKIAESNVVTVKAGGIKRVDAAGFFFWCKEATTPFEMRFDSGERFDAEGGFVVKLKADRSYNSITFYNDGDVDITITYYAGSAELDFAGTGEVKDAPSDPVGYDDAIAGNASVEFDATALGKRRKQIWVRNLDAGGNTLEIQDSDGVALEVLAAGAPPWSICTTGKITIKNTHVGPLSRVLVGQTFYL